VSDVAITSDVKLYDSSSSSSSSSSNTANTTAGRSSSQQHLYTTLKAKRHGNATLLANKIYI